MPEAPLPDALIPNDLIPEAPLPDALTPNRLIPKASLRLTIGHTVIPYQLRESVKATRKRIVVTPAGVEVVVPIGTAQGGPDGVAAYVHRRRRWVFDAVRDIEVRHRSLLDQRYASGAKLQYRGRWLMLDVQAADVPEVVISCRSKFHVLVPRGIDGAIPRGVDGAGPGAVDGRAMDGLAMDGPAMDGPTMGSLAKLEAIRGAFDRWLRDRALADLRRFGHRHEASLGLKASGYRLSDARHRWGSCGRDGVIRVHWQLVQAPTAAFEYVVAHELAHLAHRNHSPAFWATLARLLPDWVERKAMLERWEGERRGV